MTNAELIAKANSLVEHGRKKENADNPYWWWSNSDLLSSTISILCISLEAADAKLQKALADLTSLTNI